MLIRVAIPAFLVLLGLPGCYLSQPGPVDGSRPWCWTSGTETPAPDRERCFETADSCYQDAERWGALVSDPWACEVAQ